MEKSKTKTNKSSVLRGISVVLMSILFMSGVLAETVELQNPGINPDSALWGIDRGLERIRYAFTFGSENRAEYGLKIAEERLSEIKVMNQRENIDGYELAENERQLILSRFEKDLSNTQEQVRQNINIKLSQHLRAENEVENILSNQIKEEFEKRKRAIQTN